MVTPLTGTLRRAIHVKGLEYTAVLSATGLKLTPKGKRKGAEFTWADLLGAGASVGPGNNGTRVGDSPGRCQNDRAIG